jgi:FkbM family methyltransferase
VELYFNPESPFTRWVVQQGLLRERFVVIDVGCQGGVHVQWDLLGDLAEVHAFDAIKEAVEDLAGREVRPHRHYYNIALGNEDGERKFFVKSDVFASSFIAEDNRARFVLRGCDVISDPQLEPLDAPGGPGARITKVRRLDTLFAEGTLPRADVIKLDCEGFEPEILAGARESLPSDPRVRPPPFAVGQFVVFDFLFCRDLVAERRGTEHPSPGNVDNASIDRILKMMIIFEMHGLMDCAAELASSFRDRLMTRLDVDCAIDLLLGPPPHARNLPEIVQCLATIAQLRTALEAKSDPPAA